MSKICLFQNRFGQGIAGLREFFRRVNRSHTFPEPVFDEKTLGQVGVASNTASVLKIVRCGEIGYRTAGV